MQFVAHRHYRFELETKQSSYSIHQSKSRLISIHINTTPKMNQATTTLQAMLTSQHFTASPPFNYLAFTYSTTSSITSTHRTSITEWCYSIASSLELQNESVRNGMRYLDRYLSSGNGKSNECLKNQVLFQLAGITCFWVAVKMGEESVMRLDVDFLVKVCCVG